MPYAEDASGCQELLDGSFSHLDADEIVTILSAPRNLTTSVRPSMYSTIAWEWNAVP